jgi:H/ACA ribonucleoprotein complex non-core subunit NAF1
MSDPSCTDPSIPSSSTDPEITESVLTVPPSDASLTNQSVADDQVQGTELSTEIDANTVDDASLQDKIPAPMHSDLQLLSNGDQDQTDAKEDDSSSQSSSDEESSICQSEMILSDYEEEKEEKVLKTKNEIPELPPIEPINVEIPIEEPLICVGRVDQIIQDNLVIIAADNSGDYQVLDTDSVLLTKDKKPIGKVFMDILK